MSIDLGASSINMKHDVRHEKLKSEAHTKRWCSISI